MSSQLPENQNSSFQQIEDTYFEKSTFKQLIINKNKVDISYQKLNEIRSNAYVGNEFQQQNLLKIRQITHQQLEYKFKQCLLNKMITDVYEKNKKLYVINMKQQLEYNIPTNTFKIKQKQKNGIQLGVQQVDKASNSTQIDFKLSRTRYALFYQRMRINLNLKSKELQYTENKIQNMQQKPKQNIEQYLKGSQHNTYQTNLRQLINQNIYNLFSKSLITSAPLQNDKNQQVQNRKQLKVQNNNLFIENQLLQDESIKQTSLLLIKLIQTFEKQLLHKKNNDNSQMFRNIFDYIFDQQQLFSSLIIFNFTMLCYQFNYDRPFPIQYYFHSESANSSFSQNKNKLFIKSFNQPNKFKRIYTDSTVSFTQLNQIYKNQNFSLPSLYCNFVDQKQVDLKIKYFIHFIQFAHQIISDLRSPSNISLSSAFNCSRFLLLNLVGHYSQIQLKKVFAQIQLQNLLYYQLFKTKLQNNLKWTNIQQKTQQAIDLSFTKITSYIKQMNQNQGKQQPSMNSKKLSSIFKQKPQLQKFFFLLNSNQNNQQNYNPQLCKQTYKELIQLMVSQIINIKILQLGFAKICKQQQKFCQKYQIQSIRSLNRNLVNKKQEKFRELFQKYLVIYLQMVKIFLMILALPYYNYQNQRENYRRRNQTANYFIDKQLINQHNNVQRQTNRKSIFMNFDILYIYNKKRLNTQLLRKNNKIMSIFNNIMHHALKFIDFMQETSIFKKQKIVINMYHKISLRSINNQKYFSSDILSVFDRNQCREFFFLLIHDGQKRKEVIKKMKQKKERLSNKNTLQIKLTNGNNIREFSKSSLSTNIIKQIFIQEKFTNAVSSKKQQQQQKFMTIQNISRNMEGIKNNSKYFLSYKGTNELKQFMNQIKRFAFETSSIVGGLALDQTAQSDLEFEQ